MALPADAEIVQAPDFGGLAAGIFDWIQDGFYVVDRDWRFLYANRAASLIWGVARDSVIGRVLWDCFPEVRVSELGQLLRQAVESGEASEFEAFSPLAGRLLRLRAAPLGPGRTGILLREVSDRSRAAEALRANEERLRIASETARMGYWERNLATGELWSSAICKANYGLPADAELPYDAVVAAIDPAYRDGVREASRRAVRERTDYHAEYPITWPDGSRHWIAVRGRCLYAEDGTPLRNVGVTLDITERKQGEEALRLSEERLRLSQEGAGVGVWDWDLLTDTIYWSPQMFRLAGVDAEINGADPYAAWLRAIHPDDRDRADAFAQRRRIDPAPLEFDYRVVLADGSIRWILAKGVAVSTENGRPTRIAGINIDITERKRVEAELLELTESLEARVEARTAELAEVNERLRRERMLAELIVENTAEGIIVIDTEFRHLVWNAGMERINGLPRDAVLGKKLFEVFPGLVDHPAGQAFRDAVAGRTTELRGRRDFSPVRHVEIVYDAYHTPLYDQAGAIVGAICMVRDTSEHHRMEEMLRQSQKLEAVAQLTGGVAHDFNNLLTAVVGCLDMILLASKDGRIASLAETALRSAQRGSRLTQQLLAFARTQALRPVAADLNALLGEFEVLLHRAVGETIEIEIDRAPDLARCEVDPAQFEAAVMNLVLNARDAMPNGGRVVLTTCNVKASGVPADVELSPGNYVAFAVRDDGEGMPPEVAARAFEPFYTTKEIGKGSGLGLSMVYGFARQSGGGVRIDSAPGTGTGVTLYLPRAAARAEGPALAGVSDQPQRGSGSVLIVEDDVEVREMSVALLESLGYRVIVAGDGRQALEFLRSAEFIDLMFTDLVMPGGISGVALARQARLLRPALKVLLTTGYAGLESAGAEEFPLLRKPFRPAELSRAVAEMIGAAAPLA